MTMTAAVQTEPRVLTTGAPIQVVATMLGGTRDALAAATAIAGATDSRVYVIAQSEIPTGVSRARSTDAAQALAADIRTMPAALSPSVAVVPMLGRHPTDVIPLLPPRALVFIGGTGGRWWPSAAQRIAHAFTRLWCRVMFVHAERMATSA
jgi:hypothetical protein